MASEWLGHEEASCALTRLLCWYSFDRLEEAEAKRSTKYLNCLTFEVLTGNLIKVAISIIMLTATINIVTIDIVIDWITSTQTDRDTHKTGKYYEQTAHRY